MAKVHQNLEQLRLDLDNSEFRPNQMVQDHHAKGMKLILKAIEFFADGNEEQASSLAALASLHECLARDIFDAEVTEHFLGEGDFLELEDEMGSSGEYLAREIKSLEEEIIALRKSLE